MSTNEKNIIEAADRLRKGQVIGMCTETVYGLGANALNPMAVARIYELKGRPLDHPLIVHVASAEEAKQVVARFPPVAEKLAKHFWPGPLTLVLEKSDSIPDVVTGGLPSVGVRVPAHPVALSLLRKAAIPVAAPSANRFGTLSPTTADHVRKAFGNSVDFVLDGGEATVGVESTIVSLLGDEPLILRPGGISREAIEEVIGLVRLAPANAKPIAPGMLERHYAPRTPIVVQESIVAPSPKSKEGLLSFRGNSLNSRFAHCEVLSSSGDLREAASKLFTALHRLDEMGLDRIVAEIFPNHGLGAAINDRLKRASR
jgi:L-threonylcarbamoyladenylate synthase